MTQSQAENKIDYLEFAAADVPAARKFYSEVFGWTFEDYGPEYTSFHDGRIAGGFTTQSKVTAPGLLAVIYASDLAAVEAKIVAAGGRILKPVFSFPGGKRFHFADPNGNELAVWSDK